MFSWAFLLTFQSKNQSCLICLEIQWAEFFRPSQEVSRILKTGMQQGVEIYVIMRVRWDRMVSPGKISPLLLKDTLQRQNWDYIFLYILIPLILQISSISLHNYGAVGFLLCFTCPRHVWPCAGQSRSSSDFSPLKQWKIMTYKLLTYQSSNQPRPGTTSDWIIWKENFSARAPWTRWQDSRRISCSSASVLGMRPARQVDFCLVLVTGVG